MNQIDNTLDASFKKHAVELIIENKDVDGTGDFSSFVLYHTNVFLVFVVRIKEEDALEQLKPIIFFVKTFKIPDLKAGDKHLTIDIAKLIAEVAIKFDKGFAEKFKDANLSSGNYSNTQNQLFNAFEAIKMDYTLVLNISRGGNAKTPNDAFAKLNATFIKDDEKKYVIDALINLYNNGYYAPVGNFKSEQNQLSMIKKLMRNSDKASVNNVVKICKALEIGSQNGYKLDHYIKAFRKDSIIPESHCIRNKGTFDFIFFPREIEILPYLVSYCAEIGNTLRVAISRNAGKWKKESDLEYDLAARTPKNWEDAWGGAQLNFSVMNDSTMNILIHVYCVVRGYNSYSIGRRELVRYFFKNVADPDQFETMSNLVKSNNTLNSNLNRDLENLEIPSYVEELCERCFVCESLLHGKIVLKFEKKIGGGFTMRIVGGNMRMPSKDDFKLIEVKEAGSNVFRKSNDADVGKYAYEI